MRGNDYLFAEGCCLDCEDAEPGCLCYSCKCTKCSHYSKNVDLFEYEGYCTYAREQSYKFEKILTPVAVIAETKKAYLLYSKVDEEQQWFPRSQITIKLDNDELMAKIPRWLLQEKNWDDE